MFKLNSLRLNSKSINFALNLMNTETLGLSLPT